jgi:hypothetical protein
VTADAFKKQSRTSERWLRLMEVGVPDLPTFLQEQRAAGYTIIGRQGGTEVGAGSHLVAFALVLPFTVGLLS